MVDAGTLEAIKEAGRREERARIIQLIALIKDTWQKPSSFNYPTELFKLIQLIEETKP
jgi:hypothetical protein